MNDNADVAIDVAVGLIEVQMAFGDQSKLNDMYSRGYLFGLCDSLFQSYNIDQIESTAMMVVVFDRIFGGGNGAEIFGQAMNDQSDGLFSSAMMTGGQEILLFLNEETPPLGLAGYLLNGEMR